MRKLNQHNSCAIAPVAHRPACGPELVEIDPAPWQLIDPSGDALDHFLLCYDDRLVDLELNWTPTALQMAIAGEKLSGDLS